MATRPRRRTSSSTPNAAIDWASQCPASENEIIEIRQVQEMSDFSEEVQEAASGWDDIKKATGR